MLSILDGHCRYAHVGALRGDGVAPSILGMEKIIGDDSLRRALSAIAPAPDAKHTESQRAAQQGQLARSTQWMQGQLKHSCRFPFMLSLLNFHLAHMVPSSCHSASSRGASRAFAIPFPRRTW